jgi:ribosomal protein L11 methylase PrmA
MKEYIGKKMLAPRATPYREIFVSRIRGSAPLMADHFQSRMLAMWEQDGITEILFEDPHSNDVQMFLAANYSDAVFEGETGVPYSDWESGVPVRAAQVAKFLIQYSWDTQRAPAPGQTGIVLDPGLAFGTGHHPSTRQSLTLLRAAFESAYPPRAVLDLGCGSGVLSVAAAALGARVIAVDYSLVAAHAARMNAGLNKLEDRVRVIHGDAFDNLHLDADLALCNLNHTLNRRVLAQARALRAQRVLLSGIHSPERFDGIRAACAAAGFHATHTEQQGPWFSCLCARG